MNSYEALVIFKPILDVDSVDAVMTQFHKNAIEALNGEIVDVDRIGRKRLAYEIKKFKDGFLALYILRLPTEKVAEFRRLCQLNEDILRLTLVRVDETILAQEAARRAARAAYNNARDQQQGGPRGGGDRDREPVSSES